MKRVVKCMSCGDVQLSCNNYLMDSKPRRAGEEGGWGRSTCTTSKAIGVW